MTLCYSVYILANWQHTVLYVGLSSDLVHRVFQHKIKFYTGFTSTYNCNRLVYYEDFPNVHDALHREKQLKKYRREWKKNLINALNPEWKDLSEGWYDPREFEGSRF